MGQGKIEMEKDKVVGVLNWPIPKMVRDVRKFLDFANYYRQFVKDIAKLAWCHKLHLAITPQILAQFPRSRMRQKALKKTFRTMPKTCQSDQYSLRYQLISAGH